MNITCKINNEYIFDLLSWDGSVFRGDPSLILETSDLITVSEILKDLKVIEIFYDEQQVATYTQYNTYEGIEYLSNIFDDQRGKFVNVLKVRLGEKNLAEKVEELDKVVNKIVDIDSMTAEEYKKYLTDEFGARGQKEIFEGIDIELTDGTTARFTYNFEDQLNLLSALYTVMLVQDLTTLIPYHSHHNPCKLYLAADIVKIYMGLQANSIQKQTRVNMLNNWIRSLNNKEEMLEIKYDSELPQSYQEQYQNIITNAAALIESIKARFFPDIPAASEENGQTEQP